MRYLMLAVLFAAAATGPASAGVPQSLHFFVGHFSCVTTTSNGDTDYSSFTSSIWGNWVKEDITFAAGMGQPESKGTAYLGYDPTSKQWIYNEVDATGAYFVTHSSSPQMRDSHWHIAFPQMNDTTAIKVLSPTQYTVTSNLTEGGKPVSFKQICTRA